MNLLRSLHAFRQSLQATWCSACCTGLAFLVTQVAVLAQDSVQQDPQLFQAAVRTTEPLTIDQQRKTFSIPDGFRITCFASEPDIQKPMNLAFDADGRLWVTGSNGYPTPAASGQGTDTIRVLEDTNGDGQADRIQTFAEDLNIPIGLIPYSRGAIVFTIPEIVYLEDTDGDGKSDRRTKLYGPFDTSRDTHGMTNSFTAYHDGWIYACHGFNNQSTVAGTDGHAVTMHSGNTFRFRPDGSRIELVTHGQVNPFGMTLDEFGDLYTSDCHSRPVNLLIRGGFHESFGKPHDGLGFIPEVMAHQHGSTAIDGVCWSGGLGFPDEFQDSLFVGNVMTGRVHRNRIQRGGSTISLQEEDDLIVCGDPWFRPVDLQAGPDGALYIADFYNRVIGHYEVPLDHPGRDRFRGRIWRMSSVDTPNSSDSQPPALSGLSPEQLLEALEDSDLHRRMQATDLLVASSGAQGSRSLIRDAWAETRLEERPKSAAHLIWALHRTGQLTSADVKRAMESSDVILRIHSMKVCSEVTDIANYLESMKDGLRDPDFKVQRAAAEAAAVHTDVILFKELVNAYTVCPISDVHLRHAVRIALRNQLRNPDVADWFLAATQPEAAYNACDSVLDGLEIKKLPDLALAVLKSRSNSSARSAQLIVLAASQAQSEHIDSLIRVAARLPLDGTSDPVAIRNALADALSRHPQADRQVFEAYEAGLLNEFIQTTDVSDLNWGRYQWDDRPAGEWGLEGRERSNGRTSRFLSSLPGGENSVSILRSKSFVVPFQFELSLCGHLGKPPSEPVIDNRLVLREVRTGQVLRSALPPRNDKAIGIQWTLADVVGKRAVLELEDGVDQPSYAWLAIGPMSPGVVNTRRGVQRTQQERLATIVQILDARSRHAMLQAEHLRLLSEVVQADQVDGVTRQLAASVLFRQRGLEQLAPLSILLKYGRVPLNTLNQIANACSVQEPWITRISPELAESRLPELKPFDEAKPAVPAKAVQDDSDQAQAEQIVSQMEQGDWEQMIVQRVFGDLSRFYRERLAREMASSELSVPLLLKAFEAGVPSVSLLRDESLVAVLKSHGSQVSAVVDRLLESLPPEVNVSQDYVQSVLSKAKDRARQQAESEVAQGKVLFERHCSICHRRGSLGGIAGPQLDGINTRGPERILEDILYPHRNVDVAFRMSVIVLQSGQTVSGIARPARREGQLLVVTSEGKTLEISTDNIEQQTTTQQSLMPSGFHKLLSEDQMASLLTFLMR